MNDRNQENKRKEKLSSDILSEAKNLQEDLVRLRRSLHQIPESGFETKKTLEFVQNELKKIDYTPQAYGRSGLIATCGQGNPSILLRADMDALPITEETECSYASTNGSMHACGHDFHTTMLLGAARLLKKYESSLRGTVVLLFQSAEEIFQGAKDMIEAGVLLDTHPDAALMLHVTLGMPFPSGTAILCDGGVSAPAADYFKIEVRGKGCHGAMPQLGIDPITAACHIVTALQEISARELAMSEEAAITIGSFHSGTASNAIPDTATLGGTLRVYDEELRAKIKERMTDIIRYTSSAFRTEAELTFTSGCPTLINDPALSVAMTSYLKELLGKEGAFTKNEFLNRFADGSSASSKATGSEDFAYFSQEVPSLMIALAAGNASSGCTYPLHHPKVTFDESALSYGTAVFTYAAIRYLEERQN